MPRASIEPAVPWLLVPPQRNEALAASTVRAAQLPDAVAAQISRHCEATYPWEACGALVGGGDGETVPWQITHALVTANHDHDRRRRYVVAAEHQLAAERAAQRDGEEVVGYYHSHPNAAAVPSGYDREHAWPGYLYLVCSVVKAKAVALACYTLAGPGGPFCVVPRHPLVAGR